MSSPSLEEVPVCGGGETPEDGQNQKPEPASISKPLSCPSTGSGSSARGNSPITSPASNKNDSAVTFKEVKADVHPHAEGSEEENSNNVSEDGKGKENQELLVSASGDQNNELGSKCSGSGDDKPEDARALPQQDAGLEALLVNHKLQTISKYMILASNKKNHAVLLQEATVTGFLVLSLGDEDPEVVKRSFEVFFELSRCSENLPVLQKLDYFLDALRCVAKNAAVNEQTRKDAKRLFSELKCFHPPKDQQQALSELSESSKNVLASNPSSSNAAASTTVPDGKPTAPQNQDLNTTISTMRRKNKGVETILFIENDVLQQKTVRARVTQVLIAVKGIVSVTYDLKKSLCIVRGKRTVPPEDFGRAVAALGLANVYIVRKNENKEEVRTLIAADDKENVQYPAYPEEVENEAIDTSTSVARTDQPRNAEGASIFKSAKNFIKRSFYW